MTILHLSMIDSTTKYLKLAKYSLNHPYEFKQPYLAFSIAFVQFFVTIGIELSNLLLLLTTNETISLIGNFVAIIIIADFDSYIFQSIGDDPITKLVEEYFTD